MPPGKAGIVRSIYRALAAGDMATLLTAFDADAAVEHPEVKTESYHGQPGIVAWAQRWRGALQGLELKTQSLVEADDHVVVLSRFVAHQGPEGESAEARFAHVWTLQDGKVREVRVYLDWKRAMEAAGLRG
ncbi:MAG: nuclear transport factor 2 family protein [Actinomycetota bacterium]|nr:nuclear transport factor 2 family protein [Actinomycetota bacterium]